MPARVRPSDSPCPRFGKDTAPVKSKGYLSWLHQLPCIVSHVVPVEAAHISTPDERYAHLGRAKGRKASDCWTLPLSKALHDKQHKGNEMQFWRSHRIDPHIAALVLHNIYSTQGDDGIELAQRMILQGLFIKPDFEPPHRAA